MKFLVLFLLTVSCSLEINTSNISKLKFQQMIKNCVGETEIEFRQIIEKYNIREEVPYNLIWDGFILKCVENKL